MLPAWLLGRLHMHTSAGFLLSFPCPMITRSALQRRPWTPSSALLLIMVAGLAALLGGCGSTATTRVASSASSSSGAEWTARWEAEAAAWKGTPHQWGGTTRSGIDCSALVQTLYRDVAGVQLPRTTRAQVRTGERVRKRNLQPGDLVFFHLDKSRHVGVYLGERRFVHASSSHGVMTSSLTESYWASRYWTARRIPSAQPNTAESSPPRGASRPASSRSGW